MLGYDSPEELLEVDLAGLYVENDFLPSRLDESGDRELAGEQTLWRQKTGGTIRVRLTGHLTEEQHRGPAHYRGHRGGRIRGAPAPGAPGPDPEDGSAGTTGRRRGARLQQLADGDFGLYRLIIDQIGQDKPIAADLRQIKAGRATEPQT